MNRAGSPADRAGRWAANGLRLAGWLAVNALVALGLIAGFAWALGAFTLHGTLLQLANLAVRFEAATPQRQAGFSHLLLAAWATGFAAAGFFRRASLLAALERERAGA
ncbi:MAG: hypothetical protein RIS94_1035 [Pseudomonadota bacterium]|jgi:hypothetical protein